MNRHNDSISPLEAKPASTTETLARAAHEAIDNTASKAEHVEKKLRDRAGAASDKVSEKQEAATEQVQRSIKQVESFAKERPFAAAGIAFAAGVLASALLRR